MGFDPYETHLPALLSCLAVTDGPVLEIGVGEFSTPILHAACVNRRLTSVESDKGWHDRFAVEYTRGAHVFLWSPDYALLPELAQGYHQVVFIDHSPGVIRCPAALMFRKADYIVIHDYEPGEPKPGEDLVRVDTIKSQWPYVRECMKYYPHTIVLGQREIPEIV